MSPAAIVAARSAWNPSPAPVFTALAVLGLDGAWRTGDGRWLLLVGAALGFLIQLHYFALAIVFVCGVTMVFLVRRQPALRVWAVASLGIFVALLAPLLVHECLNDFPNLRAVMALAGSGRAGVVQISAPRRAYEVFALGLVGTFLASNVEVIAASVSFLVLALLGLGLARDRARRFPCVVIGGLLLGTVVQALLYRGTIFEHYLVPISPVLYLGLAAMLGLIPRTPLPRFVATGAVLCLAGLNLFSSPLRSPPDNQLAHTRTVAQLIADVAGHQPFELWLVAGGESDGAYRFWLERMGKPPVPADGPVAPQMFIVCRRASCDPAHAQDQPGDVWSSARLAWRAQVADDEILQLVLGHILDP
jgi:hypothetical protein